MRSRPSFPSLIGQSSKGIRLQGMSAPTFWKQPTFFYAFGNTPAYSLAQHVARDESAAFLLLGTGDMRHPLYTAYAAGLDEPNSEAHLWIIYYF